LKFTVKEKDLRNCRERRRGGHQRISVPLCSTTPWAIKKHATVFWTITPRFLVDCLQFLYSLSRKRNKCSAEELQNLQLYLSCVSTLPDEIYKNTITAQCYRSLLVNSKSESMRQVSCFFYNLLENSFSSLLADFFYITGFSSKRFYLQTIRD